MATNEENIEFREARTKRFEGYLRDKLALATICQLEGMDASFASTTRTNVSQASGIPVPASTKPVEQVGITKASDTFRGKLNTLLWQLSHNRTPYEIAPLTGLTLKSQRHLLSMGEKSVFNWTLSHMERLAKALNMDFTEMMLQVVLHGVSQRDGSGRDIHRERRLKLLEPYIK